MNQIMSPQQLEILRAYAGGRLGTRRTIEAIGGPDYADVVIALAKNDRNFPKPAATPTRDAHVARARAILQPRLQNGD